MYQISLVVTKAWEGLHWEERRLPLRPLLKERRDVEPYVHCPIPWEVWWPVSTAAFDAGDTPQQTCPSYPEKQEWSERISSENRGRERERDRDRERERDRERPRERDRDRDWQKAERMLLLQATGYDTIMAHTRTQSLCYMHVCVLIYRSSRKFPPVKHFVC